MITREELINSPEYKKAQIYNHYFQKLLKMRKKCTSPCLAVQLFNKIFEGYTKLP